MLPPLYAGPPADAIEERRVRRLAAARHAPASWLECARIITLSWDGAQVGQIASELGCHPRTVYRWLHRFNASGIDGLGDLPRSGRPPAAWGAAAWSGHRPGPKRPARPACPPARWGSRP
jgi:Winged helix-turn helix